MAKTQQNTVILARVSSKAQEGEGYSLESQLKLMRGYCDSKGLDIVRVFRIAETASKDQGRAIFKQLTQYIKQNKAHNLVVEKTDRLTRNLRDAVAIDDWLNADARRQLHIVKEGLLLHKEARSDIKFMWNIHLAVAKKYTDNLREEAMKGWAEKLAQGWMPTPPIPGYMTSTVDGKKIHVPDPRAADCVKRAFRLYLEDGQSITSVTQALRDMDVTSSKGRPLPRSYIEKMLKNPFYAGTIRFNGQLYPGAHQPLITQDMFDAIQAKLGRGRKNTVRVKHQPLFQGLIRCRSCQRMVSWSLQKGRYYGVCTKTLESCRRQPSLREDRVEAVIIEHLERLVCPSRGLMSWLIKALNAKKNRLSASLTANRQEIQLRLKRLANQLDLLYEDRLAGYITLEKYQAKAKQIEADTSSLEGQLGDQGDDMRVKVADNISILELSQKAAEIYATASVVDKRRIIASLFEEIESAGGEVELRPTKLAQIITDKVQLSYRKLAKAPSLKASLRTAKKAPKNSSGGEQIELLRPIWLAR